jgi:hypothetical protein
MNDLVRQIDALIGRDVVHAGGGAHVNIFVTDINPHSEGPRSWILRTWRRPMWLR